jgi:hypothetical protein
MSRSRASRLSARAALVAVLLLSLVSPTLSASPAVTVVTNASPFEVTVGLPIAYVVKVTNGSNNTLKFVSVRGVPSIALPEYFGASIGAPTCSQTEPVCDFSGLPSGESRSVLFYFLAPAAQTSFTFTAQANFDGQTTNPPANFQHTVSEPVTTNVLAVNQDHVTGHSFDPDGARFFREFTTGLGNLGTGNKHGTTAFVPENAEVTLKDLPANDPLASCSGLTDGASFPCFGQASYLSIKNGEAVAGGIKVTIRWDSSDIPKKMTEKTLHLLHIFTPPFVGDDGNNYEQITELCDSATAPGNMPCLVGNPVRLMDKDIVATFFLNRDLTVRGW